jgi:site-specific DNA-methyltransferase (adenine-specific)
MCNNGFNERWHGKKYAQNKQGVTDQQRPHRPTADVPRKSLCLVPFRFALEMVKRGWVLRNVIIWHKPNCMPSSATDRFTIDFEYLFFFTKSSRYWFELQHESHAKSTQLRVIRFRKNRETFNPQRHKSSAEHPSPFEILKRICDNGLRPEGRNKRCVWRIATQPFKGAHFATFPEKLVEIPIKAGCPDRVCLRCRQPKIIRQPPVRGILADENALADSYRTLRRARRSRVHCVCRGPSRSGIVLDPFCGSGTTGVVARRLGRDFIGVELNRSYIKIAKQRLRRSFQTS